MCPCCPDAAVVGFDSFVSMIVSFLPHEGAFCFYATIIILKIIYVKYFLKI